MRNLLTCFIALLFLGPVFAEGACEQEKCIAIVDVGSTGSRLHVYSYDLTDGSPVNIKERWNNKIKPGFANLDTSQVNIDNYLNQLFANAPAYHIPLYFYATAGMRLIPQPKQQQMYTSVSNWFAKQTQWQLISAKTISGADEGLYGWLAVNYQLGRLTDNSKTTGIMDMGGASVQIAFPLSDEQGVSSQNIHQIDLYGQHFKIFVHSFLGLGQNEVTHQFLDDEQCFATNYQLSTEEKAEGNAYACEKNVSSLLNDVHEVNRVIQPVLGSNHVNEWYTIGGLTELITSKPFQFSSQNFTPKALLEQAQSEVCQQDWQEVMQTYSDNDYIYGYCLFPAYYYSLIVDGYGVDPNQNLHFLSSDQSTDWTIGVVLIKGNH